MLLQIIKYEFMNLTWFEHHPTKSIILYTITIGAITWGIFGFLLDDRKEDLHNTQIGLLEFKLDSNKVVETQLRARIEFLVNENTKLTEQNYRYYEWLSSSPTSLKNIENENENLKNEIAIFKNKLENLNANDNSQETIKPEPSYYFESPRISEGIAFIDIETGASISVTDINTSNEAKGYCNIPGKGQKNFEKIRSGVSWDYELNGKRYSIYLKEVDFVTSTYKILIRENKLR